MAMALTDTAIDRLNIAGGICETKNGYSWYICALTTPIYSGCCRVDPCRQDPIHCPASARGVTVSDPNEVVLTSTTTELEGDTTITVTRGATHTTNSTPSSTTSASSSTSSTPTPRPTPGASAPSSPTIPSSPAVDNDNSGDNGLAISVNALVGIVVGCGILAIFAALSVCMWLGRRKRRKEERQKQAERLTVPRSPGGEVQIPVGMESIFNPMATSGPGSIFDRGEGRMAKVDSMLGFSPLAHDPRTSTLSSGSHSGIVSPVTPGSPLSAGIPSSPSELDSTPMMTLSPQGNGGAAGAGSRQSGQDDGESRLRATLNSTQQEREAGTYANSWSRFQNVQL